MTVKFDYHAFVVCALQKRNPELRVRKGKEKGTIIVSLSKKLAFKLALENQAITGFNIPDWLEFDPIDQSLTCETDEKNYNYQLIFV